jgi:hypothetical protein
VSSELEEKDASASPASTARRLADDDVHFAHSDVLNADVRWRSARLFTAEELNFETPAAAVTWMENLSARPDRDQLRQAVLNIKRELEFVAGSQRTSQEDRQLAQEIRQWLTIWLQTPDIFDDWFVLRRRTSEFLQVFGS